MQHVLNWIIAYPTLVIVKGAVWSVKMVITLMMRDTASCVVKRSLGVQYAAVAPNALSVPPSSWQSSLVLVNAFKTSQTWSGTPTIAVLVQMVTSWQRQAASPVITWYQRAASAVKYRTIPLYLCLWHQASLVLKSTSIVTHVRWVATWSQLIWRINLSKNVSRVSQNSLGVHRAQPMLVTGAYRHMCWRREPVLSAAIIW